MARIRTVKPEFWTSEQVVECSTTARLLFLGLWNFCDDRGVHPASIKTLKMRVFPADDFSMEDISGWVNELIKNGLLKTFQNESQTYWLVTGWHHQRIDKPVYKYPKPPKFDEYSDSSRIVVDEYSTTSSSVNDPVKERIVRDSKVVDVEESEIPIFEKPTSTATKRIFAIQSDTYEQQAKEDQSLIELISMQNKLKPERTKELIAEFFQLKRVIDHSWSNYSDLKSNILNWMPKKLNAKTPANEAPKKPAGRVV